MIKVTCKLPNASTNINGIDFIAADDGVEAVLEDDVAKQFAGINGYELHAIRPANAVQPNPVEQNQNQEQGTGYVTTEPVATEPESTKTVVADPQLGGHGEGSVPVVQQDATEAKDQPSNQAKPKARGGK